MPKSKKIVIANMTKSEKFPDAITDGFLNISALEDENVKKFIFKKGDQKWLRIKHVERKEVSDNNKTHYIEIDQFVPKSKGE